ncbi:MAG: glycosyltransferase family 4 protein [Candidatus Aminicenantaceae bacterium]
MKIAMLHWGFPPIIGGVETHLINLMPELVKMGHKVALLTGSAEGYPESYRFKGAKIFRTRFYDLNWLFKSKFQEVDESVSDITVGFLDRIKPDIIHAHNMHYFSRFHTQILEQYALEFQIPLILTAHNTWPDRLFLDLTCKVTWDKIIAVSHYIKRELTAVGVSERKIKVVHHGVDTDIFHPGPPSNKILDNHPQIKRNKKIIFNPARIGMAKGCDVVIEAFRLVKKKFPQTMLLMSGSGSIIDWGLTQNKDIAFFASLIKHLQLEKSFYMNTFSIDKEMPDLYRLASVVVYPSSMEEPFGLTMLEAMASGKPIIVTESGGMPEIIQNDINGYVVPKRNHKILAEKIIKLLSDEKLREKLGKTGRKQVEQMYTKEIYARKIYQIYENTLQNYTLDKKKKRTKIKRY